MFFAFKEKKYLNFGSAFFPSLFDAENEALSFTWVNQTFIKFDYNAQTAGRGGESLHK